jgi:acyl-CoA synthetase (AMP-forming)/AMP-acid ligase II
VTGRIDDMLNCSGHLMSTAQIESVLVEHAHVAEAAVVPVAHAIKAGFPYIHRKGGRYYMGGVHLYFILFYPKWSKLCTAHLMGPNNSFIKKN